MLRDPVCGKRINPNKAHIQIEHEGMLYYLCCPMCQNLFEKDPKKYVKKVNAQRRRKTS